MNKTALVCGSSGGIGIAVTKHLLLEGYTVYATSRTKPDLESDKLFFYEADFIDNNSIKLACSRILNHCNHSLNVVVNCVGDISTSNTIKNHDIDEVYKTFQINFFSTFLISKLLFNSVESTSGCFLFISSIAKDKVYPMISDYCAAKAALSNFVKSLAIELAPSKGRALAISPAVVDTPLFRKSTYTIEEVNEWHKLKRIGSTIDISELIVFLVSEKASWITGVDYIIDGGMLL